jgi:hypothetical protein
MNHIAKGLWIGLVVYTVGYAIIFGFQGDLFSAILNGTADPFASNFFNLMGLVPGFFLMDYVLTQSNKKSAIIPFLAGFFGGAYAILLGYRQPRSSRVTHPWWAKFILILLMLATASVMAAGFFQGNPISYVSLFFSDALVGIMTIDFFVLYIWSVVRAYQRSRRWYWSLFPIIGFGLVLFLKQDRR